MPITEKEYNGNLLDQLFLLEDIELVLRKGDIENALNLITRKRQQIEQKLYQNPPLSKDN